jgi:hypothetical protein
MPICPFAEHNFGPFLDIFFIIVLFESQSKTLFRVLFSSLYRQICIFYFGIQFKISKFYERASTAVRLEIHFRSAKTLRCLNPIARET